MFLLLLEVVVHAFNPSILGGQGRQMSVTLLTAWSTWKVLDQPTSAVYRLRPCYQNNEDDEKEDKKKN